MVSNIIMKLMILCDVNDDIKIDDKDTDESSLDQLQICGGLPFINISGKLSVSNILQVLSMT